MIYLRCQVIFQPYAHDTSKKYIETILPMGNSQGPYTNTKELHVYVWAIPTQYD